MDAHVEIVCSLTDSNFTDQENNIKSYCNSSQLIERLSRELEMSRTSNGISLITYDQDEALYSEICSYLLSAGGTDIGVIETSEHGVQQYEYTDSNLILLESVPLDMLDDNEDETDKETIKQNNRFLKSAFSCLITDYKTSTDICYGKDLFGSLKNQVSQTIDLLDQQSVKKNGFELNYWKRVSLAGSGEDDTEERAISVEVFAFGSEDSKHYSCKINTDPKNKAEFDAINQSLLEFFGSDSGEEIHDDYLVSHKLVRASHDARYNINLDFSIISPFCFLSLDMSDLDFYHAAHELPSFRGQVVFDHYESVVKGFVKLNPAVWTYRLGLLYLHGQRKFKLPRRAALNTFISAAEAGDLRAQLIAARDLYQHKDKEPGFLDLSIKYLKLAAAQGNTSAQNSLIAFENGEEDLRLDELRAT